MRSASIYETHYETHDLLYIGGKWIPAADGGTLEVCDPATEEPIARIANGTVADALAAMDAAQAAFPAWAALAPRARSNVLRRAFDMIIERERELARLITLENGKALPDSLAEVRYAAEFFRWFSEEGVRNLGQVSQAPESGARILVQHKPAGVCLLVTPWNYPAAMGTRKIAPALAAGCTVVLKPASETPLTMLALADILEQAGVAPGVVNILTSNRSGAVVDAMLNHPAARVVSFTGSTEVGRRLLHSAADKVINPRMELGGNAPFIVFDDADVDAAVDGAMQAKMRNLGEACTAANRFYIHERVYEAFAARFSAAMNALEVGNGLEEGVSVGALVNASTLKKVEQLVEDARSRGAKVLTGGARLDRRGYFYPPTVLSDVPEDAACVREEIFGPVAALQRFADEDDVVRRANQTEYGLAAYVYTGDMKRGLRLCERLEFGMVGLNRGLLSDPAAPFGGVKQSGLGREGAHEGLLEFLETQYVSLEW